MSKNIDSQKRLLNICKLQQKLAQRDYLGAEKNIARLEISRDQLDVMADQMLENRGAMHAALLSAKLEFGHRLIRLAGLQQVKIVQGRQAAIRLQSAARLTARRVERVEQDFRKAKKQAENGDPGKRFGFLNHVRPGQKLRKGIML
ncbi:MAG: hypothetical protein V7676_09885 [Parasphingorhabdus sp.]|uniref:hypothetical protein n=1 Tax=Parasphingorhabdus sp. TaxID=2709688 RepID=UPI0030035F6C